MATDGYGPGAVGSDGNRGIHGDTYAGEETHMPDTAFSAGSLSAPTNNLLGQPSMNGPTAPRQAMPNPSLPGKTDISHLMNGPPGLLGVDDDVGLHDDDYPAMAASPKPGEPDGFGPVNWDSVGPYEYPEFPKDTISVAAPKPAIPLT